VKNTRKKKNQEVITTQIIDQSQTGTQKSRAVSAKRTKKNDKGEAPLHIAVMDVIFFSSLLLQILDRLLILKTCRSLILI